MPNLAAESITRSGLDDPTATAADAGGDSFANDGRTILVVNNGDASPITVTIDSLELSNFETDENLVVTVPATGKTYIGPFNKGRFNDANGRVGVTYSAVTSVTVEVLSLSE